MSEPEILTLEGSTALARVWPKSPLLNSPLSAGHPWEVTIGGCALQLVILQMLNPIVSLPLQRDLVASVTLSGFEASVQTTPPSLSFAPALHWSVQTQVVSTRSGPGGGPEHPGSRTASPPKSSAQRIPRTFRTASPESLGPVVARDSGNGGA